ncbi:tRNA guanosine(34) transglycosylase Tgt [Thermodesulfobacteriota bacterium]
MFVFDVHTKDGQARRGTLMTPHGRVETPTFVAVGTLGTVGAATVKDLQTIGTQTIISNAYHLHLHPGEDLIEKMGGLHRFMGWQKPLMLDSGGFQVFSLGAGKVHGVGKLAPIFPDEHDRGGHLSSKKRKPLVAVDEEGAEFISYLDGSRHRFSPEGVVKIGRKLGADILLVLDECTSPLHDYRYTKDAMDRTHRWAVRALKEKAQHQDSSQMLMGIVQGGVYRDLREASASFIVNCGFEGYALGGSLGRSKGDMHQILEWTVPLLPDNRPRHLLGIGSVEDVFEVVERGIDLLDCIAPQRLARTGTLLVKEAKRFRIHILNKRFRDDPAPIEEDCTCYACSNYSRAYLRHLFEAKEISAMQLAVIHNLFFIETLMREIRCSIEERRWGALKREWFG